MYFISVFFIKIIQTILNCSATLHTVATQLQCNFAYCWPIYGLSTTNMKCCLIDRQIDRDTVAYFIHPEGN